MARFAWGSVLLVLLCAAPARTATVYTADFIPDGSRSHFNSFELIPNDGGAYPLYTGGSGPYIEDGIQVEQVNGDPGNDIWVDYFHPDGQYGWYPYLGDVGYTKITMADGSDFGSVGFFRGSGWCSFPVTTFYELYNDGSLVLSGSEPLSCGGAPAYLGFGDGGFDELRLWDVVNVSSPNAFAVDAIETGAVPEPASLMLFGAGLAGVVAAGKRAR